MRIHVRAFSYLLQNLQYIKNKPVIPSTNNMEILICVIVVSCHSARLKSISVSVDHFVSNFDPPK